MLEGVFGAAQTARAEAAQHIALELVGLPGYFVTVALVSSMGPKRIQVQCLIALQCICMYVCMYGHTYSKSMDQPGKVASPARGQLNRKNEYFPVRVRA